MTNKIWTPDQHLLALSLKQPYADLMFQGKIETRTWSTKYRGWVLICSSQQPYDHKTQVAISGTRQYERIYHILNQGGTMYGGKALGLGYLEDCRPMRPVDENRCFVQYWPDLFCHVYTDIQTIVPFDWKGSQGFREVTGEEKLKIIF